MADFYTLQVNFDEKTYNLQKTKEEIKRFFIHMMKYNRELIRQEALTKSITEAQVKNSSETIEKFILSIKANKKTSAIKGRFSEEFLNNFIAFLCSHPTIIEVDEFHEFIEHSVHTKKLAEKTKEGFIYKRTGGRHANEGRCMYFCKYCRRLQKRWLVVTENFIGYTSKWNNKDFHEVLMFKADFKMYKEEMETGYPDAIIIKTLQRNFFFHAGSVHKKIEWAEAIDKAISKSNWKEGSINPYNSSFPIRPKNNAKFYIDGHEYFKDIYHALLSAKEQVFITGWWVCPQLYLLRPASENPDSQIIKVLEKVSQNNVKIYVHMFREPRMALANDSQFMSRLLKDNEILKGNIEVIRHPKLGLLGGTITWAHHEKIVVIDQEIAFLGGLDMCYGRWDTCEHRLTDLVEPYVWNGIDYNNPRINETLEVKSHEKDQFNRETQPRMPWHDIAMQVKGQAAGDAAIHFIELWNHVMTDVTGNYRNKRGKKGLINTRISSQGADANKAADQAPKESTFMKEINNFFKKAPKSDPVPEDSSEKKPQEGASDRFSVKIGDVNIFHNIGRIWQEKKSSNLTSVNERVSSNPLSEEEEKRKIENEIRVQQEELEELEELKEKFENNEELGMTVPQPHIASIPDFPNMTCECQLLRSASEWSFGLSHTESSIQNAYLSLINKSEHFIYIENQFFISSTAGKAVNNTIAEALVLRIIRAHCDHRKFQVIVVMPLLPAFQGEVYNPDATVLKFQLHWEYETICRSDSSIFSRLRAVGIDPRKYINFYGLRTHALLNNYPVTEIVYVHSKLMIVDDEFAIIGSANINDRSMVGNHDSEVAMLVSDNEKIESRMNGQAVVRSKFVAQLRRGIFEEFIGNAYRKQIGEPEVNVEDPLDSGFLGEWVGTSKSNTLAYRKLFGCYPDDEYYSFADIKKRNEELSDRNVRDYLRREYKEQVEKHCIKGFLVDLPINFLVQEDLKPAFFSKENIVPLEAFL